MTAGGRHRSRTRHRVITLGEAMARLGSLTPGPLRHQTSLALGVAGAEATVAVALTRLGHPTTYLTRVGDDEFGRLVLSRVRGEGVDVEARVDPSRRTGLMLREQRTADVVRVEYWREGSAASALSREEVEGLDWAGIALVHVSGITAALSPVAAGAVNEAVRQARLHGAQVSLDVNYRAALWSRGAAAAALAPLARRCDLVFASADELDLVGVDDPSGLVGEGVGQVIVTDGAAGATATSADGTVSVPSHPVTAVDPLGAGDVFVAGYLSGWLDLLDPRDCLDRGAAAAAIAVGCRGDWEGAPRRDELPLARARSGSVHR